MEPALGACNGTGCNDADGGYDPTDDAGGGYDPACSMAGGNCWCMEGTGEGYGWVGGMPCNGTNGEPTPTVGIIGGVAAVGPAIPGGWK